jgi:hypothetical protein
LGEVADAGGVEPEVVEAPVDQAAGDGPGDDIAGGEVGQGVLGGHEGHTGLVAQAGALSPQGFRQQRPGHHRVVQRGGVELDELDVGHGGAGGKGHGDAVAGGQRRVGGDREQLTGAAAGQHHGVGLEAEGCAGVVEAFDAPAAPGGHDEPGDEPVLADLDSGADDGGEEGPFDLEAGGVPAGVDHPGGGVAAFPGECEGAARRLVEDGPDGHQLTQRLGTLGAQDAYRLRVAEAATGGDRVGEVQLWGVRVGQGGGDTPLRVAGGRRGQLSLGHQHHAVPGRGEAERDRQTGHPRAEDGGRTQLRVICSKGSTADGAAGSGRYRFWWSTCTTFGENSSSSASSYSA